MRLIAINRFDSTRLNILMLSKLSIFVFLKFFSLSPSASERSSDNGQFDGKLGHRWRLGVRFSGVHDLHHHGYHLLP